MNVFVFDIETIPDVALGRRLFDLEGLPDEAVAQAMVAHTKATTGQTFVKTAWHKIVAISAVFRQGDSFNVWSLGEVNSQEPELIKRFYAGLEKFQPTLVSWNGSGFDLPVLHYRTLLHGISAPSYWETGERDSAFKYNNYLNRYHNRHLDLMDVLSGYQQKAAARLEDIALTLGFPGKMGMEGSQVLPAYLRGELDAIRHYCETDVLNTYLIYLKFQHMRGSLSGADLEQENQRVREFLAHSPQAHLQAFLSQWSCP